MKDLVEVIADELVRQQNNGDLRTVTIRRSIVEAAAPIVDLYIDGDLDLGALSTAIEVAQADSDIARIQASIAKGARRAPRGFKL